MKIFSNDYHDYVIRDGKFIGEFDEMYRNCDDPWPESFADMDTNLASCEAKKIISESGRLLKILSLGSGTGDHLAWIVADLSLHSCVGVEISSEACRQSRQKYPRLSVENRGVLDFLVNDNHEFDIILVRELIWYVLDDLASIYALLKRKHRGSRLLVELSFPEVQQYGTKYFKGIQEFLELFPFDIDEKVVVSGKDNSDFGYLMVSAII